MKWLVIFLFPVLALAQSKEQILKRYKDRYENFFERTRQEEQLSKKRLAGRGAVKERRQKEFELRERARKRYVQSKPVPKDMTKSYQLYLKNEEKQRKSYLRLQEQYAREKRRIELTKEGALKIPPVLEYKLQDAL